MNDSVTDDDGNGVYIDIPLVQDGALAMTCSPPSTGGFESRIDHGPSALVVGAGLSATGWFSNNAPLLLSLYLFAQVVWVLEFSWSLIPLLLFGARCAAIAFEFFLHNVSEDDDFGHDDDADEDEGGDFSGAMQDPFNVGIVIGCFALHALLVAWIYDHPDEFRAAWPQLKYAIVGIGLALALPEFLGAKMRSCHRAAGRAKHAERVGREERADTKSSAYTLAL